MCTTTYLTAGFLDFRKARACLDASATIAACCGSLRLPIRELLTGACNEAATTIPVELNGLIPRLNPSSSLITAINREKEIKIELRSV